MQTYRETGRFAAPSCEAGMDLPVQTQLKIMLMKALKDEGITRAELARRLDWHREQVDRLFRLKHASRLDQIEAAFKVMGRKVTVGLEPIA